MMGKWVRAIETKVAEHGPSEIIVAEIAEVLRVVAN